MGPLFLKSFIDEDAYEIVSRVYKNACTISDHSPRFKFFTLHGTKHLDSLYSIFELLLRAGIPLSERQIFLLGISISIHDLGMVSKLSSQDADNLLAHNAGALDTANFEKTIRNQHHELISSYIDQDLGFLTGLGVSLPDLSIVTEIGKAHRVVDLDSMTGDSQILGAIIRIIDELDIGNNRAPVKVFENLEEEMDDVSRWHWFKHLICENWSEGHNVISKEVNGFKSIIFRVSVSPTREESIDYWLTQTMRPIVKALTDDGVAEIIRRRLGFEVVVEKRKQDSTMNPLNQYWRGIEERVLTKGRKVVLAVDDQIKRLQDMYLPTSVKYHVSLLPYVKAALSYLSTVKVSLVVLDLQMPAQDLWTESETKDFAYTGLRFLELIKKDYPEVKTVILTGIHHPVESIDTINCDLYLRKPIDPYDLRNEIEKLID